MTFSKLSKKSETWNQWFAGLVDADGCLLISSAGYMSLEITMSILDEPALLQIKQKLNGSVKLRSKARAFRYRLHHKEGMFIALTKLNGLCRNSIRLVQLKKLCEKNSPPLLFIPPSPLNLNTAWFAGFFDGDGTLSYYFKNQWPQLVISVSNKKAEDCDFFRQAFGGIVRLDKRSNTYKWEIYKKESLIFFYNYLKKYPLRSYKKKRVSLIPEFLQLREIRAYSQPEETKTYKAWTLFEKKWAIGSFS